MHNYTYDKNGNLRGNGGGTSTGMKYTHDCWNRLVQVERTAGGGDISILENAYNGLNWRITRKADLAKGAYDGLDERRDYYYSAGWRMVEERVDSDLDDDFDYAGQQVWGTRYIDDAVAKNIDRDYDNDWTDDTPSVYYYLTDAMFGVRALLDYQGYVQERIDYTPYSVARHRFSIDLNDDGAITTADSAVFSSNYNGGSWKTPGDSGYDPDADLNGDGDIDLTNDAAAYSAIYSAQSSNTVPDGWITDPTDTSWTDNTIGYDGYFFDYAGASDASASGLYCVRRRTFDPGMGRWMQRDLLEYVDGNNLYEAVSDNAVKFNDLAWTEKQCMIGSAPIWKPGVARYKKAFIYVDFELCWECEDGILSYSAPRMINEPSAPGAIKFWDTLHTSFTVGLGASTENDFYVHIHQASIYSCPDDQK